MKNNIKLMQRVCRYFFKIAFHVKPLYFIVIVLQILLKTIIPFITIIFPKLIIDELTGNQNQNTLIFYISLMVGLGFIGRAVLEALKCANENYGDVFGRYFEIEIGKKSMQMDFQFTEDVQVMNQKEKARSGVSWNSGGVEGLTNIFITILSSSLTLIGVVAIIVYNAPWLLLVVALTVLLSSVFQAKMNRIGRKYYAKTSIIDRLFNYVFYELPDFKYGKDIRLFQASEMVIEKGTKYKEEGRTLGKKQAKEENRYHQLQNMIQFLLEASMYSYIGILALIGRITIGTFWMLIEASSTLSNSFRDIVYQIIDLKTKCEYLNEYILFMEYPDQLVKNHRSIPQNTPYTFELKNVSFKYPNAEDYVLRHVNLIIPYGERLSIVGLNGAGKTTLIKLLTRLYDVSEGEILLNGINIKEFDYKSYHQLFSVVFQDFQLFAFSLKENIEMEQSLKDEQWKEVLALSGLENRVKTLSKGLDTSIYKFFDDEGIEPSGGEAQKIAIARALAKKAPIVVLDEPTSALDPLAEYEIYHHFNQLIENKTAIYISHRLSSSRFSDHIAVFSDSTLAEYGTHEVLVHKEDGIYAKMFATQAQYYNE